MRTRTIDKSQFDDVYAKVLRQHGEIRARLRGLEHAAEAATRPIASTHLRIALIHLASAFETHLTFEEQELWPLLHEIDAWGPAREAALTAEHLEQRTRLEQICASAEDDSVAAQELAGEVRWLVASLLQDMADEEYELATLDQTVNKSLERLTG